MWFLDNQAQDKNNSTSDQDNKMTVIETERERIRVEQVNIISFIPANTNTSSQLEQNSKDTTQDHHNSQQQHNLQQQDNSQQQNNLQQQDNQPALILTSPHSLRRSTPSQVYKTPEVSPDIDDISDLNSENLKLLGEAL